MNTLKLLSKQELEVLGKFVKSEIFHRDLGRLSATGRLFELIRTRLHRRDLSLREDEIRGELLNPSLKNPQKEMYRLMSQLFDVVKQYITFSNFISVFKTPATTNTDTEGVGKSPDPNAKGAKGEHQKMKKMKENPSGFLSYSRRELALMRFFNQRINLRPKEPAPGDNTDQTKKPPGNISRVKKAENFFSNAYERLREYFHIDAQIPVSYHAYSESEYLELLYHNFLMEHEMFVYQNIANEKRGDINLLAVTAALDRFYLLTRLELTIRWHAQKKVANPLGKDSAAMNRQELIEEGLEQFVNLVQGTAYLEHPLLELYINAAALIGAPAGEGEMQFEDLLQHLREKASQLPEEKRNDLYAILRNYLAYSYNQTKNPDYLNRLQDLHKKHLEAGYLTFTIDNKQFIHPSQLHGVIAIALKLNDLGWAENMLDQFPPERMMPSNQAKVLWNINRANVLFEMRKYAEAFRVIGHYTTLSEIKEQHYRLLAIRLYAKILYESGEIRDYESSLFFKTERLWIIREKSLEEGRKNTNRAFLDIVQLINRAKEAANLYQKFQYLSDAWYRTKNRKPAEYEWLVLKIQELALELIKHYFEKQLFFHAHKAVQVFFGGYLKILAIQNSGLRHKLLIVSVKILYELQFLRPKLRKKLVGLALNYLQNQNNTDLDEQRELCSFIERVNMLYEAKTLPTPDTANIQKYLRAVQSTIFRNIENDWVRKKIKEIESR